MTSIFNSRAESWGKAGCEGCTANRSSLGNGKAVRQSEENPAAESDCLFWGHSSNTGPWENDFSFSASSLCFSLEIMRSILPSVCDGEMGLHVPTHHVNCKTAGTATGAKPLRASFPKGRAF